MFTATRALLADRARRKQKECTYKYTSTFMFISISTCLYLHLLVFLLSTFTTSSLTMKNPVLIILNIFTHLFTPRSHRKLFKLLTYTTVKIRPTKAV